MNVSLLSENLNKKLLFTNHAISSKGQLPILSNFLIEAKNGLLTISATDLEIGIRVEIPAKVDQEGIVAIPAKTFCELISMIPSGKIILSLKKEGLELTGNKTKAIFPISSAEDFPKLYEEMGEKFVDLDKGFVDEEMSRVVFAAGQDSARPVLSGVLMGRRGGKFIIAATDGFRLSLKERSADKTGDGEDVSVVIPSRVIKDVVSMGKQDGNVSVFKSEKNNQIIFSCADTVLVGRLIEGDFPEYEKIIPSSHSTRVFFDREEMQKAVKTCYIFARETANIVKISIEKDRVIVSANTPSVGDNSVEVEARMEGEKGEIAFNARYLLELFSNVSEDSMIFEMSGSLKPGVFKVEKDPDFLHLIMPIQVQE